MLRLISITPTVFTLAALILLAMPLCAIAQDGGQNAPKQKGLQQRIDFGSSYILGQSIKSGAVYLMHRKHSDINSMLKVRQDYRKEIMEDYGLEKTAIAKQTDDQKKDK
jgi:hypothetical protein